jgi:hypothetical protein
MNTAAIISLIESEARAAGLEPTWMVRIAEIESSLNPHAVNKQSGASGLYQIMPFHNVTNVLNPLVNIRWAMQFTRSNHAHLRKHDVPVTCFTTYLAHQQGATGAVMLLKAAADGKLIHELSHRLRTNIGANDADNAFKTVQQFLDFWERRINKGLKEVQSNPRTRTIGADGATLFINPTSIMANQTEALPQTRVIDNGSGMCITVQTGDKEKEKGIDNGSGMCRVVIVSASGKTVAEFSIPNARGLSLESL